MSNTPDQLIGKTVGKCRILKLLGRGGMGAVYLGKHLTLNKPVAVKILPPTSDDPQQTLVKRFVREAQQAAKLEHTNVVQVYDVGLQSGIYYIVMQYIAGQTVEDIVHKRGRLPVAEALPLAHQAALGLAAAHEHKIIHRDIKPSNLLVDTSGRLKVADFGLSREVHSDSSLSQTGQILGTPKFMSPEQARGEREVDARADIYSLGATLFYMVTGRAVFEGETPISVVIKHVTDPPPLLSSVLPGVPAELEAILRRMLAKSPAERYSDCYALAADLAALMAKMGVAVDMSSAGHGRSPFAAGAASHTDPTTVAPDSVTVMSKGAAGSSHGNVTPIMHTTPVSLPTPGPPGTGVTSATAATMPGLVAPRRRWPWILLGAGAVAVVIIGLLVLNSLKNMPSRRALSAAETWFKDNPTEYKEAVHKYKEVATMYPGTDAAAKANKRADQVLTDWEKDAKEEADSRIKQAKEQEAKGKLREAVGTLRAYPEAFADSAAAKEVAGELKRVTDEFYKKSVAAREEEFIACMMRQDMEAAMKYVDPEWLRIEGRQNVENGLKIISAVGKLMRAEISVVEVLLTEDSERATAHIELKVGDKPPTRPEPQEWVRRENEWYVTKSGKSPGKDAAAELKRVAETIHKKAVAGRAQAFVQCSMRQEMDAAMKFVDPEWLRTESRESVESALKLAGGVAKFMRAEVSVVEVQLQEGAERATVTLEIKVADRTPHRPPQQEWVRRDNEWYLTRARKAIDKPDRPIKTPPDKPPR
ncbi:MAG: protein kinase [Planctomycetota bacterium]|nr:protein kinase [Planctomycetota bacterium]